MKSQFLLKLAGLLAVFLVASLWLGHYAQERHSLWKKLKNPETVRQLQRFVTLKKNQADTDTNGVPPEFRSMFKDAERGNWLALSNSFQELNGQIAYWASLGYGVRRSNDYWGMVEDVISDVTGKMGRRWEPRAPPPLEGTSGEATASEVWLVLWKVLPSVMKDIAAGLAAKSLIPSLLAASILVAMVRGDGSLSRQCAGHNLAVILLLSLLPKMSLSEKSLS